MLGWQSSSSGFFIRSEKWFAIHSTFCFPKWNKSSKLLLNGIYELYNALQHECEQFQSFPIYTSSLKYINTTFSLMPTSEHSQRFLSICFQPWVNANFYSYENFFLEIKVMRRAFASQKKGKKTTYSWYFIHTTCRICFKMLQEKIFLNFFSYEPTPHLQEALNTLDAFQRFFSIFLLQNVLMNLCQRLINFSWRNFW